MKRYFLLIILTLFLFVHSQCPPRIRKAWHTLTQQEKDLYVSAIKTFKQSGGYDTFTQIHYDPNNYRFAHGNYGFFPWHRYYLLRFEDMLRGLHDNFSCITLPYWAWEKDAGREDRAEVYAQFGGPGDVDGDCVDGAAFSGWNGFDGNCLSRDWDDTYSFVGEAGVIDIITRDPDYGDMTSGFRVDIEASPHAGVHLYIGGDMAVMKSPNDPFFYLHHANIDRLWWIWEDCHGHNRRYSGSRTYGGNSRQVMPYQLFGNRNTQWFSTRYTPFDMMLIGNSKLPYNYDVNDELVGLISETSDACDFSYFSSNNNNKKRGILNTTQNHASKYDDEYSDSGDSDEGYSDSGEDEGHFTDERVRDAYKDICDKYPVSKNSRAKRIHLAAIAECNICGLREGKKKYASDEWITMENMDICKDHFVPVCYKPEQD